MATATGLVLRDNDHFDEHAFALKKSRWRTGSTTSLAWSDTERMHTIRRGASGRWTLPPAWSQNDIQFREVTLRFLESRLYMRDHDGTNEERLKRIQERSVAQIPRMESCLKRLLTYYNEMARRGAPQAELDKMATQIQNVDAQICIARRGVASVVTAVAYQHFRLIHQSPEIAEAVGVKPPMVRIWAHRLQLIGRELFEGIKRPPYKNSYSARTKSERRAYKDQEMTRRIASQTAGDVSFNPVAGRLELVPPRRPGRNPGCPRYDKQQFFEMRNAGRTIPEICKATGASQAYVWKVLKGGLK